MKEVDIKGDSSQLSFWASGVPVKKLEVSAADDVFPNPALKGHSAGKT